MQLCLLFRMTPHSSHEIDFSRRTNNIREQGKWRNRTRNRHLDRAKCSTFEYFARYSHSRLEALRTTQHLHRSSNDSVCGRESVIFLCRFVKNKIAIPWKVMTEISWFSVAACQCYMLFPEVHIQCRSTSESLCRQLQAASTVRWHMQQRKCDYLA